jgi:hypothetical protein
MADATIVDIGPRQTERGEEYRMVFTMSCKLFYYYDLVTKLTPDIEGARRSDTYSVEIPVKSGQQIGWIGGQTLDFAVWDMDVRLSGFVNPDQYKGESWKIHTADPLLYYTDELKAKTIAKYIRTAEPISGKIDYDIEGRLIGNWFAEDSGGYVGGSKQNYWESHLSFAPDYIDPTSMVISMGLYDGEAKQFGVKGNSPEFANVSAGMGIVKYELVQQDWGVPGGMSWDRNSIVRGITARNHEEKVEGVVLVQLLDDGRLKFEVFPGKNAAQVPGFDNNVKVYTR